MERSSERELWIDTAKGIGMLSIMVGHLNGSLPAFLDVNFVYAYHLMLFFLLAGYNLKPRRVDGAYLKKRSRRLLLPYGISCLVIMAVNLITLLVKGEASAAAVGKSLLFDLLRSLYACGTPANYRIWKTGGQIGAIWFLPAMFLALLLFELLLQRTRKSHILGISSFALMLLGMFSAKWIWLPFSLQSALMAVFFLWIGYEIKKRGVLPRVKWYHALIALILFILGCFAGYDRVYFVAALIDGDLALSILTGLCGCLAVYYLSRLLTFARLLPYIGRNSLYVLCLHGIILESVWSLYQYGIGQTALSGTFVTAANVLVYFLFAILPVPLILCLKNLFFLKDRNHDKNADHGH